MKALRYVLYSAVTVALVACSDPLVVDNSNNPDRNGALATAADLEAFLASTYAIVHSGTLGSNDAVQPQMLTMSMENVSGLNNFAMGPRSTLPRNPIENTPGSLGNTGNLRDYTIEHRAARLATIALTRLRTLGSLGSPARDARARAFALFVQGAGLGNLALAYDSAVIVTDANTEDAVIPLSGYQDVMTTALSVLDSAIATAQAAPAGADGFPLPNTWINGRALSAAQFIQFVHSYKARFRAGVARTPAERAAADWNAVIADANAGITSDFNITMSPSNGWDVSFATPLFQGSEWHQMSQFFMGMADTSGGYDAWLNTPLATRTPFAVVTPDRRFPPGLDRPAQNAAVVPGTFTSLPYFRNRAPGADRPGDALQISMYDFARPTAFNVANRNGDYPIMTAAEIRLLAAEGYLRLGTPADIRQAARLINRSRVETGGLPALDTLTLADTSTVVPGGTACIPRVPDSTPGPTQFKRSRCGNVWDALKYEYRLETAYVGYGMWFFAARGWGDLPEGTAIHWPVPFNEMQVRLEQFYPLGGVAQPGGAAKGNYGLFQGGVY